MSMTSREMAREWIETDCDECMSGASLCESCIDSLAALLDSVRERPAWVSVEDRLPELYEMVIGWDGLDVLPQVHRMRRAPYWYDYSETDKWTEEDDGPITHWQPLPPPPEAE